mgnify:CR=1 FL=1
MEERNAKVYSDEQLASELKNKRAAGGGAKALSIAGVILVVAGLMAKGVTEIYEPEYIDRGYEHIEQKLRSLGADIKREKV